ncbi:MAG: hypothetical protein ACUVSX_01675 [Aggregatilineales bacterium]
MSQQQREWGVQSLYEEADVRDELTDDEAQALLQWAEEQVGRLAEQELDDEAFEAALAHLKRLMRSMNRFAARLPDLAVADQQAMLEKMQVSASAIGLTALGAFSAQAADSLADPHDVAANLRALMAAFSPAAPDAPPNPSLPPTWDAL